MESFDEVQQLDAYRIHGFLISRFRAGGNWKSAQERSFETILIEAEMRALNRKLLDSRRPNVT